MRDPNRIPEILNELKSIWSTFPDLRLGQLIQNAIPHYKLYYLKDKDLIEIIRDHYSEVKYIENRKPDIQNSKER
jgi:hypothetical protein